MVNIKQYENIIQNLVKNIQDKFFEILTFISKLVVKVDSSNFLTLKIKIYEKFSFKKPGLEI